VTVRKLPKSILSSGGENRRKWPHRTGASWRLGQQGSAPYG
jgi:hypothetical protein